MVVTIKSLCRLLPDSAPLRIHFWAAQPQIFFKAKDEGERRLKTKLSHDFRRNRTEETNEMSY